MTDAGAEDAPDPGELAAHRVALRALTAGPLAGLAAGLLVTLVAALTREARARDAPLLLVVATVSSTAWCALFLVAEGVAARARPRARLLALLAFGGASAALGAAAATWVVAIVIEGRPPLEAFERLAQLMADVVDRRRDRSLPFAVAVLLPFVALALARGRDLGRRWQSLVAGSSGLAAFGLLCACWGPPGRRELPLIIPVFVGAPALAALVLSLDRTIEAWLRARVDRWRAHRADE